MILTVQYRGERQLPQVINDGPRSRLCRYGKRYQFNIRRFFFFDFAKRAEMSKVLNSIKRAPIHTHHHPTRRNSRQPPSLLWWGRRKKFCQSSHPVLNCTNNSLFARTLLYSTRYFTPILLVSSGRKRLLLYTLTAAWKASINSSASIVDISKDDTQRCSSYCSDTINDRSTK